MPVRYSPESRGPSTRALGLAHVSEVEVEEEEDVEATGAAEELAAELGVDLASIEGTGKDGRITVGDVRAAAEEPE